MSMTIDPPTDITIPMSTPRVFVADDDQEFLEGSEDYLSSCDFDVNTAQTPEQARQILEENVRQERDDFHVAAIDVNYGDLVKGDIFVRKYRHLLGKAKVVLFSGEIGEVERKKLEAEGFVVLDKSRTLLKQLAELVHEESRKRADEIERLIMDEVAPRIKERTGMEVRPKLNPLNKPVFNSFKRTLIRWLRSRDEPDRPVLAYGKHVYSANEMAVEVERETEVGVKHVLMLLREYEHSLRIDKDEPQQSDDPDEE